jgi:hypothetical protein
MCFVALHCFVLLRPRSSRNPMMLPHMSAAFYYRTAKDARHWALGFE